MDFLELASDRYSVRSFSDRPVEQEKVDKILKAAQVSPTACNKMPIRIYVLQSQEALKKLQKCKFSHFGETLAFIVCAQTDKCWQREFDGKKSSDVDASIVTTQMMLEAHSLGLGSTWIMHFIPEAVIEEFNIPENEEPVSILVLGYAKEGTVPSSQHYQNKSIEELVKVL